MAVVNGIITDIGREVIAKSIGFVGGFDPTYASFFRIGTSGYVVTPSGNVPKDPDPTLTDIESVTDATYWYDDGSGGKDFVASDFSFVSPSIIQIRCRLMPAEANDDGTGANPKFFELGVFDQNDNMLFYATFDQQIKNITKTLVMYMQVQF